MDKTYAETVGFEPFDWNRWLDKAIENEPSQEDHAAKTELSKNWTTCACGNQCAIIPRQSDDSPGSTGYPVDNLLRELGYDFYGAVKSADWTEAKHILQKIEYRSAILIQKELQKLNAVPAVQL